MHFNKGKAYGRQGKAPKGVKLQHSRLLTPEGVYVGCVGVNKNYRYVEWQWKVE